MRRVRYALLLLVAVGSVTAEVRAEPGPEPGSGFVAELERLCGTPEPALARAARTLTQGDGELTSSSVLEALRAAGAPYVWPRAFARRLGPNESEATRARVKAWAGSSEGAGERRCGAALGGLPRLERVVVLAVDALAELHRLPSHVREGAWVDFEAELLVPSESATVVVLGPRGRPRAIPTAFSDTTVRARFNADTPGSWLVQLIAGVAGGPRPVLEARVLAGPALRSTGDEKSVENRVPGEPILEESTPLATLEALIASARRSEKLPRLRRSPELDRVARMHAAHMLRERRVAHDLGAGNPTDRVLQAGLSVARVGENVAHAPDALLAQRALWASPSHRVNLLNPHFDTVGIGVATDTDGSLWVCELFGGPEGP